jgi:hypothetical protein
MHPTYTARFSAAFRGPQEAISKASAVRDVCGPCNNRRLSALDGYASMLCGDFLRRMVKPAERGYVEYDFHKLARWLWKLSYNKARTRDEDSRLYVPFVPYILGDEPEPPLAQSVLVGVIRADHAYGREREVLQSPYVYPRLLRLGLLERLGRFDAAIQIGRLISINSYMFWLIAWKKGISRQTRRELIRSIGEKDGMITLPDTRDRIDVPESRFEVRRYLAQYFERVQH